MKRASLALLFLLALLVPATTNAAPAKGINLTVYNGGTALVHDRRVVAMHAGANKIAWRNVSAQMDATSALLQGAAPGSITVLEQNFDYDLLDPSALLQKYVGREVTVVHEARFTGERDTRERARILSTNGGIVLQYADRIETGLRGYIEYPSSPENFRERPTLELDVESAVPGAQTLDLSYLTGGLTWRADYTGVLSADERHLMLNGTVTLSNTSGASYQNARLQLVAGNVNVASPPLGRALKTIASVSSATADIFQEKYFEYHLYTVSRPTTILDRQTKQIALLSARDVPVTKTLELRGSGYYQSREPDLGDRLPVGVYLTFRNKGGDLGVPLPAGIVRLYENDSRGTAQFLGSDSIDHTPRNQDVRLSLGDSFDVTAQKRQTAFRQTACSATSAYEIVISNAKETAQDVQVIETIPGSWRITAQSSPYQKTSSQTASWNLPVPAGASSMLTYTAVTSWC